jgi:hypothetical protein
MAAEVTLAYTNGHKANINGLYLLLLPHWSNMHGGSSDTSM